MHNLVISNVPGPPAPLYFMGAQVEALHPLGPVFHGAGLNITVMSNNGRVHVGIIACRESMPDVETWPAGSPPSWTDSTRPSRAATQATPITEVKGTRQPG